MTTALGQKVRGRSSGGGSIGPWTPYSPDWYAGATLVDTNEGNVGGFWRDDVDANGLHVTDLQISVWTSGIYPGEPAGDWTFQLPNIGANIKPFADFVGAVMAWDNAVLIATGTVHVRAGNLYCKLYTYAGASFDDSVPFTWDTSDHFDLTVRYGSVFVDPGS